MAEQVREVLREARVLSRQRALDPDRLLILGDQQTGAEHDQANQYSSKDSVVACEVLPLRFALRRHVGMTLLQLERRNVATPETSNPTAAFASAVSNEAPRGVLA